MNFRLIKIATYEDYGKEFFFQVLTFPKFALLDAIVQWDEFPASELFPMLIISIGSRSLCGFTFRWKWFQIKCDAITSIPRNLRNY